MPDQPLNDNMGINPQGSGTGDGADSKPLENHGKQASFDTLDELLSAKGRYKLRELAEAMKDSGALRIKDHRTIQGNFPNTFKGECAFLISLCFEENC
jgi:hypothetical protein